MIQAIRGFGGEAHLLEVPASSSGEAGVEGVRMAHGGRGSRRPRAFHSVFLNGSPSALGNSLDLGGTDPGTTLLRFCRRLLASGGTLVMAAPNRFGAHRLRPGRLGAKSGDEGSESSLPRSHLEYHRLLYDAGFHRPEVYFPWPSHDSLRLLIPADAHRREIRAALEQWPSGGEETTPGLRASSRTLQTLGPRPWLFSHFYMVARLPPSPRAPHPPSPLDSLLEDFRDVVPCKTRQRRQWHPILAYRPQSANIVTSVGGQLAKIPLYPTMTERLRREVDAVRRVRPILGRHVPEWMEIREHQGFAYAASPWVPCTPSDPELRVREALKALRRTAEPGRLVDTGVWGALAHLDERGIWKMMGVPDLLEALAAHVEGAWLPVGVLHGDMKAENVLSKEGEVVLIDWDGFDPRSPPLLDAIHAAVWSLENRQGPKPGFDVRLSALNRIRHADPTVPFLDEIRQVQGDLHSVEALCLYVMHYVSRGGDLLLSGGLPSSLEVRFRRHLRFSRSMLSKAEERIGPPQR